MGRIQFFLPSLLLVAVAAAVMEVVFLLMGRRGVLAAVEATLVLLAALAAREPRGRATLAVQVLIIGTAVAAVERGPSGATQPQVRAATAARVLQTLFLVPVLFTQVVVGAAAQQPDQPLRALVEQGVGVMVVTQVAHLQQMELHILAAAVAVAVLAAGYFQAVTAVQA
jgi:hypothetical protein